MKNTFKAIRFIIAAFFIASLASGEAASQKYVEPDKPMKYWTKEEFREWEHQQEINKGLMKALAGTERNFGMHNGNKLRTLFYNYGSIGRPNTEPSIEWPIFSGNGYAYEFGAMVGSEVIDRYGQKQQIFSDGMADGGDRNMRGGPNIWGWEPLPGWAVDPGEYKSWSDVEKDKGGIAMSSRPRTWGDDFPENPDFSGTDIGNWRFDDAPWLWPGQFGGGVLAADLESFYKMDDRWNEEFEYYPFISDSTKRGLGVEVTVRGYQYAASLAEDIIFFIHEVTNVSDKDLDTVVVGMVGDPHIGGAGDFSDDFAGFVDNENVDSYTGETHDVGSLIYAWDNEGSGNDFGLPWEELGWLAFKFLESPGDTTDLIDNDGDGMIDESRSDGIDNDGDWQPTDEEAAADVGEENFTNGIDDDADGRIDDLGDLDGKSDDLNGNGVPDPGEPDFDETDLDESDQLGLTSLAGPIYGTEEARQDDIMWRRMKPGAFDPDIQQDADNIFIFGSGYFPLLQGRSEKFSIAVIVGQNKEDMLANAYVAEWVFRLNFQFTKAPDPPNVWAVAGDRKVTLYWDDISERSVDPVFGEDFEGYKIYRGTRPGQWGLPITNNQGIEIGYMPIAQFDLVDGIEGTHPVEFARGLHFDSGKETGLEHVYVDSPLVNDITYYYAITAYDSGSIEGKVSPLESSKVFGGPNVISDGVVPRKPAAGYREASLVLNHISGPSTAKVTARVIDRTLVDSTKYDIVADKPGNRLRIDALHIFTNKETGEPDTAFIWDDLLYADMKNLWNNKLLVGPYEVFLKDVATIKVDSVVWTSGRGVLEATAVPATAGVKIPRDLELRFFDHVVDTTVFINPQEVNFQVVNVYDDEKYKIVFTDKDGDGQITSGDNIVPITTAFKGLWEIEFGDIIDTTSSDTTPKPGDVLTLYIAKPMEDGETYTITGIPATTRADSARNLLDEVRVVPNPYVATSSFEVPPAEVFSVGRGERRVNFINLPKRCTIRIYTISGEHIRTIEHDSDVFSGTEPWNLLTKDNLDIAYGIYIYHLDAPGVGEKLGRIAIIK